MELFASAEELVGARAPAIPVTCLRPHAAVTAARYFQREFPGEILYAVKSNPRPEILDALVSAGIDRFDAASIAEIALISRRYPGAKISFMHPVKNRHAIASAYFDFEVRDFALDSGAELEKIVEATGGAHDLTLMVRLAVSNDSAELDLSAKFGIPLIDAAELLLQARAVAERVGVSFHVGSQCMDPSAYSAALQRVSELIGISGVMLDIVDVGGGFPTLYPALTPPPLDAFMAEIKNALGSLPIGENCEVWAEPGRALVAEAASTLVRVDHRRGNQLYINDGTYGSLFDAGVPGFAYPVRAIRLHETHSPSMTAFSFFGPTCDAMDAMAGPFHLPDDMAEGDYIEIGQTGAYGATMRTNFNGFYSDETAILTDTPFETFYPVDADRTDLIVDLEKSGTEQ